MWCERRTCCEISRANYEQAMISDYAINIRDHCSKGELHVPNPYESLILEILVI